MTARGPDALVEVARFRFRWEAEMAAGRLDDAGIPAFVLGDDAGGMIPGMMSASLHVPRGEADRARAVLAENDSEDSADPLPSD